MYIRMGHHVYLVYDRAFVAGLFERKVKKKKNLFKLNRKTSRKKKEKNIYRKRVKISLLFFFFFFFFTKSTPKIFQIHCQAEYLKHK